MKKGGQISEEFARRLLFLKKDCISRGRKFQGEGGNCPRPWAAVSRESRAGGNGGLKREEGRTGGGIGKGRRDCRKHLSVQEASRSHGEDLPAPLFGDKEKRFREESRSNNTKRENSPRGSTSISREGELYSI